MNRIYQGKVLWVEILQKEQEQSKRFGPDALRNEAGNPLWHHHEIFQDAVNYYLIALAALAHPDHSDSDRLTADLRRQLAGAWDSFPRSVAGRAVSLRDSVSKWLPRAPHSLEDAFSIILEGNEADPRIQSLALALLLQKCGGESAIQQGGRTYYPRFCVTATRPTWDYSSDAKAADAGKARLAEVLHAETRNGNLEQIAKDLDLSWTVKVEPGRYHSDKASRERLREGLRHLCKLLAEPKSQRVQAVKEAHPNWEEILTTFETSIDKLPEGLSIQSNRKASPDLTFSTLVFKYFPHALTADLLALYVKKPKASPKVAARAEDRFSKLGDDPIRLARGERGYVFPAFTALPLWKPVETGSPVWTEFDIAAFKEALKTLNQFRQKTDEREKQKSELAEDLSAMLGKTTTRRSKDNEEVEETEPLDPALFALARQLEAQLSENLSESELGEEEATGLPGEAVFYHREGEWKISHASLRGFRDIAHQWNQLHQKQGGKPSRDALESVVKDYQREERNQRTIGSVQLLLTLCDERYWSLWLETEKSSEESEYNDFLFRVAEFHETFRDYLRTQEPIRFTPAEPRHSRRLYMFSDVKGEIAAVKFRQNEDEQLLECAIARHRPDGTLSPERIRICYSAPRLLRDELTGQETSRWIQPMMKALGFEFPEPPKTKIFESAVSLMPDWTSGSPGELRLLLNFPVNLDPSSLKEKVGKEARWAKQFNGVKGKHLHLHWPGTIGTKSEGWWKDPQIIEQGFNVLATDLGQKTAGAWALLHVRTDAPESRFQAGKRPVVVVGYDSERSWIAEVVRSGILRLPGEEQKVQENGVFRPERSGMAGRNADNTEYREGLSLAAKLIGSVDGDPANWIGKAASEKSLPEQNDALITLARRRLTRLNTYHRWSCFNPNTAETEEQKRASIDKLLKELEQWDDPDVTQWRKALESGRHEAFARAAGDAFVSLRKELGAALITLSNRVAPLRDRSWEWHQNSDTGVQSRNGRLLDTGDRPSTTIKIRGQRGLSLKRIEQLENLRRLWLRYNRAQERDPGVKVNFGRSARGERPGEPCQLLLDKIDRIKEQRVNQTAHLILAQALGVTLGEHLIDKKERHRRDIHGEYVRIPNRAPVDLIVIEDLGSYRTAQVRGPSENSRLMKWCQRAVRDKLTMLAEPFGLPIVEVTPAHSSRFCAQTFRAGDRCQELSRLDDFDVQRLMRMAEQPPKSGRPHPREYRELLEQFELLEKLNKARAEASNNASSKAPHTLLMPRRGGTLFVAHKAQHPVQADINAAINIGLRAIAAPESIHLLHRVRAAVESGNIMPLRMNAREKAAFAQGVSIEISNGSIQNDLKAKQIRFFYNPEIAKFETASLRLGKKLIPLATSKGLWTAVNQTFLGDILRINRRRLSKWCNNVISIDTDDLNY